MNHAYPDDDPEGFVGLRYWVPPENLRRFFGSIYLFTANRPSYHDLTRADVPQLRFMLAGHGHYEFFDGTIAATPQLCMLGPTMGATSFTLATRARVLGVSVLPLGWAAFGCDDANVWCDALYDASDRHGSGLNDIFTMLKGEADPDIAVSQAWAMLAELMGPYSAELEAIVTQIDAWLSDQNNPHVDDLIASSGLSARQVARYTNRLYGASPKLLARKYRALRCASQIVIDRKNWKDLCEDGTFYDQPHFIREIKRFLGLTPHQLLNDPTIVAQLTVQRRALTGLGSELNRIS